MFIGRTAELSFLTEQYNRPEGQLIVLYGRRRIGKTETLLHFCKGKRAIFYSCIECPDMQQLSLFSERVLIPGNPAEKYISKFDSWGSLFSNIGEFATQSTEKLVLVIDEFPYMVRGNSSIPSILQNTWDTTLKSKNVMLILCGSAMSFMEKEILAEKNPLYGRATGILKMQEMNYRDAFQFLGDYSTEDKLRIYSITGGIPHYLKQFDPSHTVAENVIRHVLTPGSVLFSEVEFLLRQELRETGTYNAIIQAIALGNTKLNEIHQKTLIEKTKLSAYLKNLIDLGIVWKEFSVDAKVKEQANVNRGLYKLTDCFFSFWYSYVFPNYSELESGDAAGIWKYVIEPTMDNYTSHTFEIVCWQYLRQQNKLDQLPFHFTKIGHWWNKTEEIDVMAIDHTGDSYLLGECKYKKTPVGMKELQHLQERIALPHAKQIFYYLFSKGGFTDELINHASSDGNGSIRLVTLDML